MGSGTKRRAGKICQTISDDNLRAIAGEFGVTLNEAFLD